MSQKFSSSTCFILILVLVLHAFAYTGKSRRPFACDPMNAGTRNLRFCKVSLPIHVRVQDLIGRLTLQEKIRLL
ncbi:beta-D-xylosidase, partial [Datura stramonium]|nr:beta-D-xylosidase [Datura stramonium]